MHLTYFGSGAFGLPTLQRLATGGRHTIDLIVTQPDRPAGRGGKLTPTPVAQWAAEHLPGVTVLKPEKVNEAGVVEAIRAKRSEAFVVIAFGQKLGRALLDGVFAINLHASLLPRWRGAAPINAAILAGDSVTGNSVITLADRMDAGLVLAQSRRPIDPLVTAGELHDALAADGPALVEDVLERHGLGSRLGDPQNPSLVTIATKLGRADGRVDFHQPADFIRRQIHALTPWPGVAVKIGPDQVKLLRAQAAPAMPNDTTGEGAAEPGSLLDPAAGVIACGHGTRLKLLEVQPAGKRPMAWGDYARGRKLEPNTPVLDATAEGR